MLPFEVTVISPTATASPEELLSVVGKPIQLDISTGPDDRAIVYTVIDAIFLPQNGEDGALRLRSSSDSIPFDSGDTIIVSWA